MGLIIERWLDDTDERITKDDIVYAAYEALSRIEDLEAFIANMAEDDPSIPKWIQESARSVLAGESE